MSAEHSSAFLAKAYPDDLDSLPTGSVVDGKAVERDQTDIADYVVVGSGAAGATAAKVLSTAGYSVVIIEEGPWVRTREFGVDVYPAMKKMFREMGASLATGRSFIPVIQGRCVGGSTTINSAIAWRVPENVVDRWNRDYDLKGAVTYRDLDYHYSLLDKALSVRPVHDQTLGNHSSLFAEAALKMGIRAERIQRYDGGCVASASCLTGCRTGKKLSMNVTHIPMALHKGARIYTSTRGIRAESAYGRVTAVQAEFQSPGKPKLRVVARRGVIIAGSATQTPLLLKRSGAPSPAVGKHFQAHPGTSIAACFDRDVSMHYGATQGFNSVHYVDVDHFKLETLSLPPEMLALRLPGIGPDFMNKMLNYKNVLNWAVCVRAEAQGVVSSAFSKSMVHYVPTRRDMDMMRKGLKVLSEMMFAAGAREVWPSVKGMPILRSADDLHYWDQMSLDPRASGMMVSHLFGSSRMGSDPSKSAVGLDFQVHGLRGLYVLDSSIFPTNIGVNPQHTIMAMSHLGSTRIAETPLPSRS